MKMDCLMDDTDFMQDVVYLQEEELNTMMNNQELAAMDPYPYYPILDGASDMCTGKGDGCDVCGVARKLGDDLGGVLSCSPTQLPLLDWSDVEDQLGDVEDTMRCVNINQIFNMPVKSCSQDSESASHTDKVISDCMWSSSSSHRLEMSELDSWPLPALSVENDAEFSRPDTPQTDSEAHFTDSDDLIQRVPKERSVRKPPQVPEKPPVTSGRSLLKRNQFSLKVARAPLRPESKASLASPSGDSSYSGDHSYSATNCIGILTPSPSPSESSSEDDQDARSARLSMARQRRAPVDSLAVSERLLHRPLKARKRASAHKYRGERCRLGSDDDQAPPERRNNHNNMERLRRDLLRGALNSLRRLVPDTAGNDKAPKITVLREAAKYCLMLRSKDEALTKQKRRLEEHGAVLRRRLELLQRAR